MKYYNLFCIAFIKCKIEKEENNFFKEENVCKSCLNEYKREKIECKIYKTMTTRNYYYEHMKKHPQEKENIEIPINGKRCTKCNIDKPLDNFHNDKSKKDGKASNCKECRKNKSENIISGSGNVLREIKENIDNNHCKCIPCNKIISKTNWCKHEKSKKHRKILMIND
jgi:hypothetical protein